MTPVTRDIDGEAVCVACHAPDCERHTNRDVINILAALMRLVRRLA